MQLLLGRVAKLIESKPPSPSQYCPVCISGWVALFLVMWQWVGVLACLCLPLLSLSLCRRFGDNSVQDTINSHSVQQLTGYCGKYKEMFGSSSESVTACHSLLCFPLLPSLFNSPLPVTHTHTHHTHTHTLSLSHTHSHTHTLIHKIS